MAFRKKWQALDRFDADILVISESESPEMLAAKADGTPFERHIWAGENQNKGVSIFARNGWDLNPAPRDPKLRFVLPVLASKGGVQFPIIGLWTQAEKPHKAGYATHFLKAVEHYTDLFGAHSILLGDTNSSPVFKELGSVHLQAVAGLEGFGQRSLYHEAFGAVQGEEPDPTFYLTKKREKPYHLDYIFAGSGWVQKDLFVGLYDDWIGSSDHMPLVATLDNS